MTWYVDYEQGQDTNPGTRDAPLRTLFYANQLANDFDIIRIRGVQPVDQPVIHIRYGLIITGWD